jgi:isopentenyl-diphosphate Delta-isomerase
LYLNPLQECIQPRGDKNFNGLVDKINILCSKLSMPVIAKRVGNGISGAIAQKIIAAGVKAIDLAVRNQELIIKTHFPMPINH